MAGDNPSERLRQAIALNDLALVRRILRIKPYLICNPNFGGKADTSLHLAASLGYITIAVSGPNTDEGNAHTFSGISSPLDTTTHSIRMIWDVILRSIMEYL